MNDNKLKLILGTIVILLLTGLIVRLNHVPGGMILSGLFLGGMVIIGILIGCLIVSGFLKLIFKKSSFLTMYLISATFCFSIYHYVLYSPTLKVVVPKGYTGAVNLVLSNVDHNILTLDSNGIGYIDKWTFDKTYTEPIVIEADGSNINYKCIGFNPSTFWAKGTTMPSDKGIEIKSLSFEIVPKDKIGQKQYYSTDLTLFVDKKRLNLK